MMNLGLKVLLVVVALIFGLGTLRLIFWYIRDRVRNAERNRQLNKLNQLPVRYFPLIGHFWYLIGSCRRFYRLIYELIGSLETPFVIWFGTIPAVALTKLEDIEEVSKNCTNKNTYGFIESTLEDGIIAHNHEMWKKTRRLLSPAFGPSMLTQYLRSFDEQSRILVNLLQPKATKGEAFDLWPFLINAHIDTISQNVIGVQPNCQKDGGNKYSEAVSKLVVVILSRAFNPLLHPDFIFKIYSHLTGLPRHVKNFRQYSVKPINEALKNIKERTSLSSEHNIPKSMMDVLLAHHLNDPSDMTKEQMRKEINHLIGAGSETTAVSIGFLALMYGIHQKEQEIAYQEIKNIVGDDRPITMEDLNQLKYVGKTIKETLRLFTIIPLTYRNLEHDLTLPSGDTIPESVAVGMCFKFLHDNSSYFPNPEKWNPENFSAEAIETRPQNSFAPFGLGARACIGSKYAMLSIKTQVCHLLRKYRISTDTKLEDIVVDQDILLRSRYGYVVKLQTRQS